MARARFRNYDEISAKEILNHASRRTVIEVLLTRVGQLTQMRHDR